MMTTRLVRASVLALCLAVPHAAAAKEPAKEPAKEAVEQAPAAAAPDASKAKPASPGQSAARARQQKCGAEWRGLTDAEKTAQGPKWPQFWSKCNKRLKGNDKA